MTTCGVAKGVPEESTKSGAKEVHAAERFFKCDFKDHIAVEQYENPFWFREPRASRNGWNSLAEIMKLYTQPVKHPIVDTSICVNHSAFTRKLRL